MTFTQIRQWFLATVLTAALAATLLMIAVPAEAGPPSCYGADYLNGCCVSEPLPCSEVRVKCRLDPLYQGWKIDSHGDWQRICGASCGSPVLCATP